MNLSSGGHGNERETNDCAAEAASQEARGIRLGGAQAEQVLVTGTFCDWQTDSCVLKKDKKGVWRTTLSLIPGRYEYRFLVDGAWRDDPSCTERVPNPFGAENCVLHVLGEGAETASTSI